MNVKQFISVQREFFVDVAKAYFAPVMLVINLVSIPIEMLKQFIISMMMDSGEFQKLQELKAVEEEARMMKMENALETEAK
jgi:hypothetical protein